MTRNEKTYSVVKVTVQVTDELTRLRLSSYLQLQQSITLMQQNGTASSDVLVFAADRLTSNSLDQLRNLNNNDPLPTVLIIGDTQKVDEISLLAAVEHRTVTIIPRNNINGRQLVESISSAPKGEGKMPPEILGRLLSSIRSGKSNSLHRGGAMTLDRLSPREVEVIRLLADGLETQEIANKVGYSERTIKYVIHRLLTRLQSRNRTHAVAYGLRSGII